MYTTHGIAKTRFKHLLLFGVLLSAAVVHAAPTDWCEGDADQDDGATRAFYNRGASLAWQQLLGDWADRDGTLYGNNHWAVATVEDTDSPRYIEWDVTDLVQAWQRGDFAHRGFFLHAVSTGRNIIFSSREAASDQTPQLVVETSRGESVLPAVADTYLPESTFQSMGQETEIFVGQSANALLHFDIDLVSSTAISAKLRLHTTTQYDSIDIAVERVVAGREGEPLIQEQGIASAFDDDNNIASHDDVVMFEDFEATDWLAKWTTSSGTFDVVADDPDRNFEPLSGRALRVTIPQDEHLGLSLSYNFDDKIGSEPEAIYLRYSLRLGSTWAPTDSGKLPGISGTYDIAGWGGRPSHGDDGWSARGSFTRPVFSDGDNPLGGYTPIGSYVYHADMEDQYGDNFIWVEGWGEEGIGGVLQNNRWYCLEVYVQMNTPTEDNGVLRAWVDGRKSLDIKTLRYRTEDSLKIEKIWMNVYHGGGETSPHDQHLYIDNVVVARSYIGPIEVDSLDATDAGIANTNDGGTAADTDAGAEYDAASNDTSGSSGSGSDNDSGCNCAMPSAFIRPSAIIFCGLFILLFCWRRYRH